MTFCRKMYQWLGMEMLHGCLIHVDLLWAFAFSKYRFLSSAQAVSGLMCHEVKGTRKTIHAESASADDCQIETCFHSLCSQGSFSPFPSSETHFTNSLFNPSLFTNQILSNKLSHFQIGPLVFCFVSTHA